MHIITNFASNLEQLMVTVNELRIMPFCFKIILHLHRFSLAQLHFLPSIADLARRNLILDILVA